MKKDNVDNRYFFIILLVIVAILITSIIFISNFKKDNNCSNDGLIFEITSGRINCSTGILKVYNNGVYRYYRYKSLNGVRDDNENYDEGKYKYNVLKILNNNKIYKDDSKRGPYSLKDRCGKDYAVYDSNRELNEFLEEININLDSCRIEK